MQECGDIFWALMGADNLGDAANPPPYAPPILKHGDLLISQTPNILSYLGPRLALVPSGPGKENDIYKINALALTALDGLSNEVHDCHHPISKMLYYEDQKTEAIRRRPAARTSSRHGCRTTWGTSRRCSRARPAAMVPGCTEGH